MSVPIHGHCDEKFAVVREAFEENFKSGGDVGATFCATLDGETVIDLWGGWKEKEKTNAWEENTIVNVYSTTKTMAALTMLLLADRGEIDFHEKVATYWPEFAQNGKGDIEVRHIMSHSAGLSGMDPDVTAEEIYSQDRMAERLAAQKPWWDDRTQSGYHAITQGWLQAEIVRRVTGKTLGTVFAEEIAGPMGEDFYIGVPPEKDNQLSIIIPGGGGDMMEALGDKDGIPYRTFTQPPIAPDVCAVEAWRRAEIPAGNGHGNARAVARIHRIIALGGTVDGRTYLSSEGVDRLFEEQTNGTDLVLNFPIRFGLGFGLSGGLLPLGPRGCYWGGAGGSLALIDQDTRMTCAYVMNQMSPNLLGDMRGFGLLEAFAEGAMAA